LGADEQALAPLRDERAGLLKQLDYARKVRPYWEQLDQFEDQHAAAVQQLAELDGRARALAAEQSALEAFLAGRPDETAMREAQVRFKESDNADKACRELDPRRDEHARLLRQRDALTAELDANAEEVAALDGSADRLAATEVELSALGDPRTILAS